MSTIEKLFAQIFESKQRIIDQVKHHIELYDRHLASKLLIDGVQPPPWLLNAAFHSQSSDFKDLKKEELISGILLTHPQPAVSYSHLNCSIYNNSTVPAGTNELSDGFLAEKCSTDNNSEARVRSSVNPVDVVKHVCKDVSRQEISATSPPDQAAASTSEICPMSYNSLGKIQRSRSRQRALELRNSANNGAKSCVNGEKNTSTDVSEILEPGNVFQLLNSVAEPLKCGRCSSVSNASCKATEEGLIDDQSKEQCRSSSAGRIERSKGLILPTSEDERLKMDSYFHNSSEDCHIPEQSSGKSSQLSNPVDESVNPFDINNKSCGVRELDTGDYLPRKMSSHIFCGSNLRSSGSNVTLSCVLDPLIADSSSGKVMEGGDALLQDVGQLEQLHKHDVELSESASPMDVAPESQEMGELEIDDSKKNDNDNAYCVELAIPKIPCDHSGCANKFLDPNDCHGIAKDGDRSCMQSVGKTGQFLEDELFASQEVEERVAGISQGLEKTDMHSVRITRARSSAPYTEKLLHLDSSYDIDKEQSKGKSVHSSSGPVEGFVHCHIAEGTEISQGMSLPNIKDLGSCLVSLEEHPSEGKNMNECSEKKTVIETGYTEGTLNPINTCAILGHKVNRSMPVAAEKSLFEVLINKSVASDPQKLSARRTNAMHNGSTENNILDTTTGTEPILYGPSVNHVASPHFEEVSFSRPRPDIASFVEPKILNFDNVEGCHMNTYGPELEMKFQRKLSKTSACMFQEPVESLNTAASRNHHESCSLPSDKLLPMGQGHCSKGEFSRVSSECHIDRVEEVGNGFCRDMSGEPLNFDAVSCAKETDVMHENADVHTAAFESENAAAHTLSVKGHSPTFHVSGNVFLGTSFDADRSDSFANVGPGELGGEYTEKIMSECSEPLDTDTYGHPRKSVHADFNENEFNPNMDVASGECQISMKTIQPGRTFVSNSYSSWPQHKRRKIQDHFTSARSASLSTVARKGPSSHESTASGYLNSAADYLKSVDASQLSADERFDLETNEDATSSMKERFESSLKLQGEVGFSLEGINRSGSMPISFKDSGLESLSCSCLTEQAPIDSQISPAEQIGLDPVIIAHDVSKQRALERNQHSSDPDGPLEMNPEYGLFPHSLGLSHDDGHRQLANADQEKPVFEGFFMQVEHGQPCILGEEISLNELDVVNSTIKRDSVLEQLCRSAGIHTPSSQISNSFCGSVSDGLQGHWGSMSRTQPVLTYDDCSPFSSVQFAPDISIPCTSPAGKIWEGFTFRFSSGSSERKRNSNPELTCYPIKEEDNGNIEEAVDEIREENGLTAHEIQENCSDLPAHVSVVEAFSSRESVESVNTESNSTGVSKGVEQNLRGQNSNRRVLKESNASQCSVGASGDKRVTESIHGRGSKQKLSGKNSLRVNGPKLFKKGSKHNNIISNITSLVPLVQQKQAAAAVTGKRDVKVKALEAAEAAKRLEEKRENERKMKKEAMKLQRTKWESEKERKKMKMEEQKKIDADMATKKRIRDEGERKEKERKRKRVEDIRRQQRDNEGKLPPGKGNRQILDEKQLDRERKLENETAAQGDGHLKMGNSKPGTRSPSIRSGQKSSVIENRDASSARVNMVKVTSKLGIHNDKSAIGRGPSYELSPYQGSDDEDEEDDDIPNKKFIPSWASRSSLAQLVYSQQKVDPNKIFPPDMFCDIDEVISSGGQRTPA